MFYAVVKMGSISISAILLRKFFENREVNDYVITNIMRTIVYGSNHKSFKSIENTFHELSRLKFYAFETKLIKAAAYRNRNLFCTNLIFL